MNTIVGPPSFDDIRAATRRIAGRAVRTPLVRNDFLDERCARRVWLKPEMLQRGGSFKFRGAYNRISQLSEAEAARGVVAWSSGNHAQGVAAAAQLRGVHAKIVMPEDAPAIKLRNTKALGAEVITYDRYREDRETISFALAEKNGAVVIPSYDDPHIIAGQGTVGLEIFEDVSDPLDALLVCCGGGGLTAGCALSAEALSPATAVFCVEPEGYDDHARSLQTGQRERADTSRSSLCDALLTPSPGEMTFAVNHRLLTGALVVSEEEVCQAVSYAFEVLKLVVEPGGAVGLAALLSGKLSPEYTRVGIVLSGGNVDPTVFAELLARSAA